MGLAQHRGEARLATEEGIVAVAHLVQLLPPASSVLVAVVTQSKLPTLLNGAGMAPRHSSPGMGEPR